jgi:hypothetical protein
VNQDSHAWGPLAERYSNERPRRLLALDGGGIRGVLTLSILKALEQKLGSPLWRFFDYIAGTSTGAIIAAGLARGMSVDELLAFYRAAGPAMFQRSRFLERLNSLYRGGALERQLKDTFGEATDLSAEHFKTLLLVVTQNVTTDSPWPISNNPFARYNVRQPGCNLDIPLWKLVRASTAAPIYFPPEVVQFNESDDSQTFVFVDGGLTPYNNPAFLLYRFATHPAYRLNWRSGERHLLLVSVGTGAAPILGASAEQPEGNMLRTGLSIPSALMYGASVDQDINCRLVGRCTHGAVIDSELLDLIARTGSDEGSVAERLARPRVPLETDLGQAFLYCRYNVDLSAPGLAALGFPGLDPKSVQRMDNTSAENLETLFDLGNAAAKQVDLAHLGGFAPA